MMVLLMIIHRKRLLTVAVLVLILFNNCANSQRNFVAKFDEQQQQPQQQTVQSNTTTTTAVVGTETEVVAAAVPATTITHTDDENNEADADAAVKEEINGTSIKEQQEQQQQQQQYNAKVEKQVLTSTSTISDEQSQSQQQQQQLVGITKNGTATATKSTAAAAATLSTLTSAKNATPEISSSSTITTKAAATKTSTTTTTTSKGEHLGNSESSKEQQQLSSSASSSSSIELLNESEDGIALGSILPTTYRPQRPAAAAAPSASASPTAAQLSAAQERERKLMNVLAARRSALHRGGFRTRVGTTGRSTATATPALIGGGGGVENGSRAPSDPRTICIRNCTKNFTRRTTASCMRQCANFSRTPLNASMAANATATATAAQAAATGATTTVVVRPSSKVGTRSQAAAGDRDTNEILFTDESSHGLFVVTKEQNDTANHIGSDGGTKSASGSKQRLRGKHAAISTTSAASNGALTPTSIEVDDIQPYLYFGQKLPPLKPATLTITAVSDDHPRLLEVSVAAEHTSTTPAPTTAATTTTRSSSTTMAAAVAVTRPTLSAVERSRSRYKYNMRDRVGATTFNRRYSGRPPLVGAEHADEVRPSALQQQQQQQSPLQSNSTATRAVKPAKAGGEADGSGVENTAIVSSSTPLIITVLNEEEELIGAAAAAPHDEPEEALIAAELTNPTAQLFNVNKRREQSMKRPLTTTTTTSTTTTPVTPTASTQASPTTTTTSRTTTTALPSILMAHIESTSATAMPVTPTTTTTTIVASTTTEAPTSPKTTKATKSTARTTTTTTQKPKSIIEEDTERLRALGPMLTQEINTDDKTNLIIFLNRSMSNSHSHGFDAKPMRTTATTTSTTTTTTTTLRPLAVPQSPTTDSTSTILRTTVLTSVRSTVNPRNTSDEAAARVTESSVPVLQQVPTLMVGIIETTDADADQDEEEETQAGGKHGQRVTAATTKSTVGEVSSTVLLGGSSNEQTAPGNVSIEMHRMNIVTLVLIGIGLFPLLAVVLYLVRNFMMRRRVKVDGDFDVCITDSPITPVKKIDASKFHSARNGDDDDDVDEVDHEPQQQQQQQQQTQQHHHHPQPPLPPIPTQHQSKLVKRDSNHNHMHTHAHALTHTHTHNHHHQRSYDEQCSVTSDQEFDRSNIRLKSLLGEGNFGQVWKAEADDLSGHFGATRIVAVKTIRACSAQVSLKDEANIMRKLGSHSNVVTLLGACVENEPHMIIMEYAMRGRLLSLLRAARSATSILPASVPGGRSLAPLSPRTLAGFALDIACGMEYIAEKKIVHRDLAARNVLLDHNGVCKICDFGMSIDLDAERKRKEQEKNNNNANDITRSNSQKFKFDFGSRFIMNHWSSNFGNGNGNGNNNSNSNTHCTPSQLTKDAAAEKKSHHHQSHGHSHGHGHGHGHETIGKRHALPIRWMAPEALQYHIFTTETDIWAFGIVLWEIATLGSTPYSQLTGREVIRRVPHGIRPELPKEGRHEFYNLMARCWHKDPQMRPSFTQARVEVTRSLHKWVDDDSAASDYMDVSGFSEDLEHGMVYFNHRISEFECEI